MRPPMAAMCRRVDMAAFLSGELPEGDASWGSKFRESIGPQVISHPIPDLPVL
jgi:hypothetical protein